MVRRFKERRKRTQFLLLPLSSLLLFAGLSLAGIKLHAQDATPAPAAPDAAQPPTDTAQPPANVPDTPAQARQLPPQTPEQRAKVLRDAQARVRTRKQQRIAAIIADTYSHQFEAYFGGGYLRFRPGSTLQHDTEADWNVGITDYFWPQLGITADFRGYYGTTYTGNNIYSIHNPSISQYTFMAGPQYRLTKGPRWATSVQVLGGVGHGNFDTGLGGLPGGLVGLYPNATVVNASVGVTVDYNLGPGLALRLTPGVLFSDYGSELQYNAGFNAGVVYRFGHRR
ncbi:MAG TPA: hypothetical protein VGD64_01700 [Acidisarcina sp.]